MGAENSSLRRKRESKYDRSQSEYQQIDDFPSTSTAINDDTTSLHVEIRSGNKRGNTLAMSQSLYNIPENEHTTKGTLVVVNDNIVPERVQDPLITRLMEINSFEPIMQEVEASFWSKKPLRDIQSRIKSFPLIKISSLYSDRLRRHAENVAVEQGRLTKCVKEVDYSLTVMMKAFTVRQKKFASHAEKFNTITDMSRNLSRCNMVLAECLTTAEFLNELLPVEERLEPFEF